MHVPINVKSPNNISERQMGFNSAFKGLNLAEGRNVVHLEGKRNVHVVMLEKLRERQIF